MLHPLHYNASFMINARVLTEHDKTIAKIGRYGDLEWGLGVIWVGRGCMDFTEIYFFSAAV
jgi:hypothetical protein